MRQAELEFTELIPGLPEELSLECLTRLHYTAHSFASQVCRRWWELLRSRDFYYHRKQTGRTRKVACLIQSLPSPVQSGGDCKPPAQPSYGVSVFDPVCGTWSRIDPLPKYPNGLPLFCQVAGTEGKLVVMGGWDPVSWDPVRDVFVFDFTTRSWTQCKEMPSNRSFFAVGTVEGRVFIAGGHDEAKNALNSAWVFDIISNEWSELNRMGEERDECEGIIIGSEFWVVSGYDTETQGRFKTSAESLELRTGEWRLVQDAWMASQCPRSSVGTDKNGNLICWAETDPGVRVGSCGVELGDRTLLTGSAYQGAPHGFYFYQNEGQNGKLVKIDVPGEFSGFVRSGCCVEI